MACECETYGYCSECRQGNARWLGPDELEALDLEVARSEAIAEIVARVVDRIWPPIDEVRP